MKKFTRQEILDALLQLNAVTYDAGHLEAFKNLPLHVRLDIKRAQKRAAEILEAQ